MRERSRRARESTVVTRLRRFQESAVCRCTVRRWKGPGQSEDSDCGDVHDVPLTALASAQVAERSEACRLCHQIGQAAALDTVICAQLYFFHTRRPRRHNAADEEAALVCTATRMDQQPETVLLLDKGAHAKDVTRRRRGRVGRMRPAKGEHRRGAGGAGERDGAGVSWTLVGMRARL